MAKFKPVHGFYGTKLYWVYRGILKRCGVAKGANEKQIDRYANRGISVCDEWVDNPSSFYEWSIANGYKEGLQLDRIDNDGNYCPENCRWVTKTTNMRNTSQVFPVACSIDGSDIVVRFDSVADAAEFLGVSKSSVLNCINARQLTAGGYLFWRDNTRAERMCTVDGIYFDDFSGMYTIELSCGCVIISEFSEAPEYCLDHGMRVVR